MVIVLFRRQYIFLIINVILKFYTVLLVNEFVITFGVKFAYVALVACIYMRTERNTCVRNTFVWLFVGEFIKLLCMLL